MIYIRSLTHSGLGIRHQRRVPVKLGSFCIRQPPPPHGLSPLSNLDGQIDEGQIRRSQVPPKPNWRLPMIVLPSNLAVPVDRGQIRRSPVRSGTTERTQFDRHAATIHMDGKQFGDTINHKLSVPFFYFSSESSKEDRKINAAIYDARIGYSLRRYRTASPSKGARKAR